MAAKSKKVVVPDVTETTENYEGFETVAEDSETPESPVTDVFPSAPIETRIMQLLRRRGGVGGLHQTVSHLFPGEPIPSTEDEWVTLMNRLER